MNLRLTLRSIESFSLLVSQLLVALMMACMLYTIVQFGRRLDPGWDGSYLPVVGLVVTLEAMYSRRIARHMGTPMEWVATRGAELVILLLLLKVLLYLLHGPAQFLVDLAQWRSNFLGTIFSGEFSIAAVLVVIVWILGTTFGEDLDEMGGDEALLGNEVPVGIASERMQMREALADRVFYIGLGMVVLAVLARLDMPFLWGARLPVQGSVLNLLVYFMLALALLSQTQLAILRAGWSWERIPLSRDLAKRWTTYGLIFLILLVGVAFVLPTNYTVGLLAVVRSIISAFVLIMAFLWSLLLIGLTSLIRLVGLGRNTGETEKPVLPDFKFFSPNTVPYQPGAWLELLKSIFFWIVFLGIIGFSIYQYVSQHRELLARLRRLPGMTWIGYAWKRLMEWARGLNSTLSVAIQTGWQRLRPVHTESQAQELWRYVNLRRMPPRERVRFFYLALVRRGREVGTPRAADQTPYEYETRLKAALQEQAALPPEPSALDDLQALTGAFVEARYSRHPISEGQAGQARSWWQRVRKVLRRKK